MPKYCCFFCPESDYLEKELTDSCPICGRAYNYPLENIPAKIGDFKLTKALGRGFYSSTYVAERKRGIKSVLKLTPKSFYEFKDFHKTPFDDECQVHVNLATNADYIVKYEDDFSEDVMFEDGSIVLPCNIMVLEYVEGPLLKEYLDGNVAATPQQLCQITLDLLSIINQFRSKKANHNDLHSENLIVKDLSVSERRVDAICDSIKVMAIDLGSVSDRSKSSKNRDGDLTFVSKHIGELLKKLLSKPYSIADKDYRIALKLQDLLYFMGSSTINLRLGIPDFIKAIRDAYTTAARPFRPWSVSFEAQSLSDHMNAQTLESWLVPSLLVDPNNQWLSKISIAGPQIITGMRGCGKTMLLRALDIHARINQGIKEEKAKVIKRIKEDGYVGLFVSAQKLLDLKQYSLRNIESRLTRLFVNYSLEAVRALMHVQDIDNSLITLCAHSKLGSAVADYLVGGDLLKDVLSLDDLERSLTNILVKTNNDSGSYSVTASPSDFFPHLAEALRNCSELFYSSAIFYLLDDVSTRYHDLERIGELVNALLFQNPKCAFKFTSEWQTIELGLKSPGREHPIRIGRDIDIFDLGADVHETIKGPGLKGNNFVASILEKRAKFVEAHPKDKTPKEILGDVPINQIAKEIAKSSSSSTERKNAYRGLSCISKMCVGDLGDVIKIYDEIIRRYQPGDSLPIKPELQSNCFIEMSSARLYDLNRRDGYFKNHALAFAEASYDLMVRSRGKKRIRMYTAIYVRVTTESESEANKQINRLRDLIDASVFVYTGGSGRTKTKDSNPIRQFILSYRKIYGISSFIGLSDRDRFELSGVALENWLNNTDKAKEILIRNQTTEHADEEDEESIQDAEQIEEDKMVKIVPKPVQLSLFDAEYLSSPRYSNNSKLDICIEEVDITQIQSLPVNTILSSLGFEDRTLEANKILASTLQPKSVCCVKYHLDGYSKEIRNVWKNIGLGIKEIESDQYYNLNKFSGLSLIDISGLSKPFIFKAIHNELTQKGEVIVSYASAKNYYPLQEDLNELFLERAGDDCSFLEGLANILVGEEGPYSHINLLSENQYDPSRSRALMAFAPTKHQRLFSLLDSRDFDWIEIVAPEGDSPRDKVAKFAGSFIAKNQPKVDVTQIDTKSLPALTEYMGKKYFDLFVKTGANVEIGLTGSKIEAVASAILAVQRQIAEVWYLKPTKFDPERFSSGFEKINFYKIATIKK